MEVTSIEVREVKPTKGLWLTQVEDVPPEERIFSDRVFLAKDDAPENWHEVTDDYKRSIEALIPKE